MKIISNYSDYYDSCSYMCGENTFVRYVNNGFWKETSSGKYWDSNYDFKELEKIFKKYINFKINYFEKDLFVSRGIIIIGQLIIPLIAIQTRNFDKKEYIDNFFYDIESIENFLFKYENDISTSYVLKRSIEHFSNNYKDFYNKIRTICKEPIITFVFHYKDYSLPSSVITDHIAINCPLKLFNISKILQPHDCIQEIDMFLNNNLSNNNISNFTDNEKLIQHGFDNKSFKK